MQEEYKKLIVKMLDKIESEKFLQQIYTIVSLHLERHA